MSILKYSHLQLIDHFKRLQFDKEVEILSDKQAAEIAFKYICSRLKNADHTAGEMQDLNAQYYALKNYLNE
jgi:hypothetical protein